MFDISIDPSGLVHLTGRLDSAQAAQAQTFLDSLAEPAVIDCSELEYISSAGLRVLLTTQKRLAEKGKKLRLINMTSHIREVFQITQFHLIFDIET